MKIGIIIFPGSNCDHDAEFAFRDVMGAQIEKVWHKNGSLPKDLDMVFIPGGFSYGDYLRTGAIARFANIMTDVIHFAKSGHPVMGVCNGFQVLTECHLLPGALIRNRDLKFSCKNTFLRVENDQTRFTNMCRKDQVLTIPIAHGEGNFYVDSNTLNTLETNGQVLLRYVTEDGQVTDSANPNGSLNNIAGIMNKEGNVMGMMPHPERAVQIELGSADGAMILRSVLNQFVLN
jgi:phosphoribosylformylglycinamidine synthase I